MTTMNIAILDDYQNIIEKLRCFDILKEQHVQILHRAEKDIKVLAEKLHDTDILVLTRERTEVNEQLLSYFQSYNSLARQVRFHIT